MKTLSLLSVIMPVYNAESFLSDAINSVLGQSYKNLELIIINDGSTDKSELIVQSFNDDRVKYFRNEENSGIVFSRNRGLKLAKGEFIGMVDADDIVYPEKFEKQIEFLKQNPEYGFVGSWARFIDENGNRMQGGWKLKASPEKIPAIMLFKNYFLQSAVLYQKDCIKGFSFTKGFDILEDYLIWYQILKEWKGWNLPDYLVDYRIHGEGVTKKHNQERIEKEKKVFKLMLQDIGINAGDHELGLHVKIRDGEIISNRETLLEVESWLLRILKASEKSKYYSGNFMKQIIVNRWLKVCNKSLKTNLKMLPVCLSSKIFLSFISKY